MSASSDLQTALKERLEQSVTAVLGDGSATEFTVTHNLGMQSQPPIKIVANGVTLAQGTDYSVELVNINSLTITALQAAPAVGAWRVTVSRLRQVVPIVKHRKHELAKRIEEAVAKRGLCIYVFPPLPTRAEQGVPFIFFPAAEVRLRILESPALNLTGVDAYDLIDDVMAGLHWQQFGDILSHPLQLAERPVETLEDAQTRMFDVIFEATYGFAPPTA